MKLTHAVLAAVISVGAGCVALQESESDEPSDAMKPAPVVIAKPAPDPAAEPPPALPTPEPVPAVRTSEVETLIADYQRVRRLPAAELAREQETARQVFNQLRTDACSHAARHGDGGARQPARRRRARARTARPARQESHCAAARPRIHGRELYSGPAARRVGSFSRRSRTSRVCSRTLTPFSRSSMH